jgi:hypothetical protein
MGNSMGVYELGDYVIDRQSKQVYEIIEFDYDTFCVSIAKVNNLHSFKWPEIKAHASLHYNFIKLEKNCPAAQVLYGTSINKAVSNETNEK